MNDKMKIIFVSTVSSVNFNVRLNKNGGKVNINNSL